MVASVEINIFCILLLGIIFFDTKRKEVTKDQRLFFWFIIDAVLFCISDLLAYIFNGKSGNGALSLLYISNFFYFSTSVVASYIWFLFVTERTGIHKKSKHIWRYIVLLPTVIFMVLTGLSPVSNIIYSIDLVDGVYKYSRGNLLWIHWIVAWGYLLASSIIAILYTVFEKDKNLKNNLLPLFIFPILPFLGSVIQIFYGKSIIQIGMALSAVFVHIKLQDSHVWTDTLTSLPNRSYFHRYLTEKLNSLSPSDSLFLMMIDIDKLKGINDVLGHSDGDLIIKNLGYILKKLSQEYNRTFVARYDGDEFAFFGYNYDIVKFQEILTAINERVEAWNRSSSFSVDISIGYVKGTKNSFMNSDQLIDLADMEMQKNKANKA